MTGLVLKYYIINILGNQFIRKGIRAINAIEDTICLLIKIFCCTLKTLIKRCDLDDNFNIYFPNSSSDHFNTIKTA